MTGTTLPQATVELFISRAEGMVNKFCTKNGVTIDNADESIINAAYMLAMWFLRQRERADGTKPSSYSLGGWSFGDNNDNALKTLWDTAYGELETFKATSGNPWAESGAGDTIVRTDHRMKRMKLDHEVDYEYHDRADEYGTEDV